ncbi:MAG: glycyl-radical enzyme activating protein [Christensenellales bacterium]
MGIQREIYRSGRGAQATCDEQNAVRGGGKMAIMGLVMSVQRFSLHDGPGVRTTAFLMGCNLRCRWCHNPESFLMKRRMMFYQNRCVGCGRCVTLCNRSAHVFAEDGHHMDPSRCIGCNRLEACAQICPAEAMVMCGKEYTPEELVRLLAKDRVFYAEDGGVTFSGGEALLQDEFLGECLQTL